MADGIRGKHFENFDPDIQKGIILHRAIDTFTDAHPIFRKSTKRLHEKYHHYAGVIVDIYYDHFLAKNWSSYSDENLADFVDHFYESLHANKEFLTERTKGLMPYMINQNWLLSYQSIPGIRKILTQMDHRTKNQSKMQFATEELINYNSEFEQEFTDFFEELQMYVQERLTTL